MTAPDHHHDLHHHASLTIAKRRATIDPDHRTSVIIAMRHAMRHAIIDIIMTVENHEDIIIIIRLVITGSYHKSNMSVRTAAVVK